MRPRQIRVFDGLRITTEHMDHLQGAMLSGLQDLREIAGLRRVHRGLQVLLEGAGALTIQPGLAFDSAGNRLICDEPKSVQIVWEPQESVKYVCLQYEQVEQGQMEGQNTLLWDSCSAVLRPALPNPTENLVPLSRVVKADDGSVQIESLIGPRQEGEVEEASSAEAAGAQSETPTLKIGSLHAEQGIVRFPDSAAPDGYLRTALVDFLKGAPTGLQELGLPLAEMTVMLPFSITSLTCHAIITAEFHRPLAASTEPPAEATAGERVRTSLRLQATAHGDVVFAADGMSQHGVSTILLYPGGAGGAMRGVSELTDRGVAHLPLDIGADASPDPSMGQAMSVLRSASFLVRVDQASGGFKVACDLLWSGGAGDESIRGLEAQAFDVSWETVFAWKALGEG